MAGTAPVTSLPEMILALPWPGNRTLESGTVYTGGMDRVAEQKPQLPAEEEEFTPKGTIVLMILYALVFAAGWASVYFGELLARR